MAPDTSYCLTACEYLPEKRQVVVELASGRKKVARRFGFYPSAHAPKTSGWPERVGNAAKRIGARRFEVLVHDSTVEARAATFDDLLALAGLVESERRQRLLVLGPERQFLVSRNWSYFDCFDVWESGMEKTGSHILPDAEVEFLPKGISETASELMGQDCEAAGRLLSGIALSNILCIRPQEVKGCCAGESFLERALFDAGVAKNCNGAGKVRSAGGSTGTEACLHNAVLDFSPVLAELLTSDFMNAGHETLNCPCCRPQGAQDKNVMPNSLALVEFRSHGIYFNSNSALWAQEFHQKMPCRERRAEVMREWCLNSIPAGPFGAGQRCEVPLADALMLQEKGSAEVVDALHRPVWFCNRHESRLSKGVRELGIGISGLELAMRCLEGSGGGSGSIKCYSAATNSAQYAYLGAYRRELAAIASSLHSALTNPASVFFEPVMADAISTTLSLLLSGFREFSSAMGERNIPCGSSAMFVDAGRALMLAKGFAASNRLPAAKVAGI